MVGGKSKDMAGKQIMAGWTPPEFHVKVVRENEDFASSGTRWNLVGPCKWCGTWPRWCGYYPILSTPKSVLGDQQGPVQLIESLLDRSDSNVVMNLSLLNLWLLCYCMCKQLPEFKYLAVAWLAGLVPRVSSTWIPTIDTSLRSRHLYVPAKWWSAKSV